MKIVTKITVSLLLLALTSFLYAAPAACTTNFAIQSGRPEIMDITGCYQLLTPSIFTNETLKWKTDILPGFIPISLGLNKMQLKYSGIPATPEAYKLDIKVTDIKNKTVDHLFTFTVVK